MVLKLCYFAVKARAETAKVMLNYSGIDFENVTITGPEWRETYKAQSPTGQVPYLVLDDGQKLCQSSAINLYCAGKAGLLPSDPIEVARAVELTNCLEEIWQAAAGTFKIKDPEEKLAARKALIAPEGDMTKKMQVVEDMNPRTRDHKPSTSTPYVEMVEGFLDGVTAEYTDGFKKIAALRTKVASLPKVKEMYAGIAGFEP